MRITMCGTANGGSTAAAGANVLVEAAGSRLLFDCGHSSVNSLVQALGPGASVDALLFSHLHFDHVVGLPELFARFAFERRQWPSILGPSGTPEYVAEALRVARALSHNPERQPPPDPGVTLSGPGDTRSLGDIEVTTVEVPHVPYLECVARRLDWDGGSIVYSGDTTDAPEIMTSLALGAGVLIHECFSAEGLEATLNALPAEVRGAAGSTIQGTHTRVETAAAIARDAEVETLVLTHLLEGEDPANLRAIAERIFNGRIIVARDGLVIEA